MCIDLSQTRHAARAGPQTATAISSCIAAKSPSSLIDRMSFKLYDQTKLPTRQPSRSTSHSILHGRPRYRSSRVSRAAGGHANHYATEPDKQKCTLARRHQSPAHQLRKRRINRRTTCERPMNGKQSRSSSKQQSCERD